MLIVFCTNTQTYDPTSCEDHDMQDWWHMEVASLEAHRYSSVTNYKWCKDIIITKSLIASITMNHPPAILVV